MAKRRRTPSGQISRLGAVVGVLGGLILLFFQFFGGIDAITAKMHLDGGRAGSLSILRFTPVHRSPPALADVKSLVQSWRAFADSVAGLGGVSHSDARALAHLFWTYDFVFVALYGGALVALIAWARRRPPAPDRAAPDTPAQGQVAGSTSRRRTRLESSEDALRRVMDTPVIFVVVGVAMAANVAQDVLSWRFFDQIWAGDPVSGLSLSVIWLVGLVKWIAVATALAPCAFRGVAWVVSHRSLISRLWLQLLLVGAFGVLLRQQQVLDLVRGWDQGDWVWTGLAVAGFGAVLTLTGSGVLNDPKALPAPDRVPRHQRLLAAAGLALVAYLAYLSPYPGLAVPAGLVAVTYLLAAPIEDQIGAGSSGSDDSAAADDPTERVAPTAVFHPSRTWAISALAVMPLVMLWGASVTAKTGDALYRSFHGAIDGLFRGSSVGVVLPFLLVVPTVLLTIPLRRGVARLATILNPATATSTTGAGGDRAGRRRLLIAEGAVIVPLTVAAVVFHLDWGTYHLGGWLGGVAVLGIFLAEVAGLGLVLGIVGRELTRLPPLHPWLLPPPLRLLGFTRPPLITLVVLWAILAPQVDPGHYHETRTLPGGNWSAVTLDQVAQRWAATQPATAGKVPALFVSASGGGIRAAYWTAAVMTCVIERQPKGADPCGNPADPAVVTRRRRAILVMSGISGSSLGIVNYQAHEARPDIGGRFWYTQTLDHDFLTPTVTRWFFGDVPNVWLRSRSGDDRAAVLEKAWERAWGATSPLTAPFLTSSSAGRGIPLVILNGYSVENGCRLNVSLLRSNGGRGLDGCNMVAPRAGSPPAVLAAPPAVLDATTDVADFLQCNGEPNDIRLSTAALLSARFPYVTPSGRLDACNRRATTFVVDGGYRDTSAASTITELWPAISPALGAALAPSREVRPVFVQIDNGYAAPLTQQQSNRPSELAVPLRATLKAMEGVASAARQSAKRTFGDGFVEITTHGHPGSEAPLGWDLSHTSRTDLDQQLQLSAPEIERVRCLIDEVIGCPAP